MHPNDGDIVLIGTHDFCKVREADTNGFTLRLSEGYTERVPKEDVELVRQSKLGMVWRLKGERVPQFEAIRSPLVA